MKKLLFFLIGFFCFQCVQSSPQTDNIVKSQVRTMKKIDMSTLSLHDQKIVKKSSRLSHLFIDHQKKRSDYSWMQSFVESIEDGQDFVEEYIAVRPKLLTQVDKVTGLTPVEIAVLADNELALKTILSIAQQKNSPLAIAMAVGKAQQTHHEEFEFILKSAFIQDVDLVKFQD